MSRLVRVPKQATDDLAIAMRPGTGDYERALERLAG